MAISIDFATKIITVPQADCILVSGNLYRLPTKTVFRAQVIALAAAEEGVVFPPPIDHNADYTVFGVTYAPKVEVINGYSVTFTPDTAWSVLLEESNNNIADIEAGILNPNNVTVIPNNSGGLILASIGTSELVEDYPVDGQSSATVAQLLYSINQMLSEFARTGTTVSIKKRDGTEAFQLTLDNATAPTSSTQSS